MHTYIHTQRGAQADIHTGIHTGRQAESKQRGRRGYMHIVRATNRQAYIQSERHTYIRTARVTNRDTYNHTYIQASEEQQYIHTCNHTV